MDLKLLRIAVRIKTKSGTKWSNKITLKPSICYRLIKNLKRKT